VTTKIEWVRNTDGTQGETWNPVSGCTKVSEGCRNCYAERMAKRLAGRCGYPAAPNQFDVTLHPDKLDLPLRWRKPRMVFVVSMGDLFHEDVPFDFIEQIYGVMAEAKQHTFQVLTKRPGRAAEFLLNCILPSPHYLNAVDVPLIWKNVWLGTSVENQATADERIPLLLQTPAAVRFVSAEPLLEEIDLTHLYGHISFGDRVDLTVDALSGKYVPAWAGRKAKPDTLLSKIDVGKLDWVICGTESGPGARPWDWDWIRNLRDQCQVARVPFFLKQVTVDGKKVPLPELDGRTWSEMPGQAQEVEVEG